MVLARAVRDEQGRTLLPAGVTVAPSLAGRLEALGIDRVYVVDPRFEGIAWTEEVPPGVRTRVLRLFGAWEAEQAAAGAVAVAPDPVRQLVAELLASVDPQEPVTLWIPADERRYLPQQAVNAARLAVAAAPLAGLGAHAADLAAAALVRDVGMLALPAELRARPAWGPEERAAVREHVAAGLAALDHPYWNAFVKVGVAQHHERWDGSGYPRGLAREAIHPVGALLGAADCYCALVSPRPHRPALPPEEALEMLLGMADWLFPAEVVRAVASCVGLYAPGTVVRLSTGEEAIVTHPGRGTYERPRLRLLGDGRDLDLGRPEHLAVRIASVVAG
jgi:HD-GYP domain-containing protein (c-di-GMP phosphodiesterase class II)